MTGLCSPKHGPVRFTVLKKLFVWMLCSLLKPFKFMAGPLSPTSLVTAQLISRRWRVFSFWRYADCQQRSIHWLVVLPQTRSSSFHGVQAFFRLEGGNFFKNTRNYGLVVLPQTRPSSFHGVEKPFRLDVMQPLKINQVYGWVALPNIPCHGPAYFAALKSFFVVMSCRLLTTFKKWFIVFPQTRSSSFQGVKAFSCLDGMKLYKNIQIYGWVVLPQTRPSSFHGIERNFCLDVMQPHKNHSSLWLGRSPQHLLSQPSSFRGVEGFFRRDVLHIFNNVQINGWSCYPKHGPTHFTVLSQFFVWMIWSFSKTFKNLVGPCSPKHGPVPFTVLKNFFPWMWCSQINNFIISFGLRSPTSPVTAELISRRWKVFSSWCYEKRQQCSVERLVVLPQTRSSPFHGVKQTFCLDSIKLSKNIQSHGWAVLFQARPRNFYGVEKLFSLNVMQPDKNYQVYGWAALPNIFCHGPAHFAALKNHFVLTLCRLSNTFK